MPAVNDRLEEAESRIGTVLRGKWRLEKLLGVGGMAAVYEARHKNESRVAVKILHRRLVLSTSQLTRFQREGYAANRVGHPGIPEVYDDDLDEHGSAFLVMELLTGETAAGRASRRGGRLPVDDVLDIADRVLDILLAAHARGIWHRDIKPENLFLTDEGEIKVLDFGIARFSDPELEETRTEAGTLLGTPAFVPPEQARGLVDAIDARTDLWAVGATMFTLLTGQFVHVAKTPNEQVGLAMTAAARSLADPMPTAPAALITVVDRALAYSQKDRWQSAQDMLEAVRWLRTHWGEIETCPDRVPEHWETTPGEGQLDSATTVGDEQPVSSGVPPGPRRSSRILSVVTPWIAVVVLALLATRGIVASSRSVHAAPTALAKNGTPSTLATEIPPASRSAVTAPPDPGRGAAPGTSASAAPVLERARRSTAPAARLVRPIPAASARERKASGTDVPAPVDVPSTESPDEASAADPYDRRH